MDSERIIEQGEHLSKELAKQQHPEVGRRWRCPVDLRSRIVAYAVACSVDGESLRQIAERLGVTQRTLSRWMARWRRAGAAVRQVAIVPSAGNCTTPQPAHTALRLVTPRGFVVEGLDAELLASLLQVLG